MHFSAMKRTGRLPRRTLRSRVKAKNAKRRGSRFPHRRDPEYCAWIRTLDCSLVGAVIGQDVLGADPALDPLNALAVRVRSAPRFATASARPADGRS